MHIVYQLGGQSYDNNGNRTSWNGNTLAYDPENRAARVGNLLTQAFTGDNVRAWKQNQSGARTYFVYDGESVLCELDASGNPVTTYSDGPIGRVQRYTHGTQLYTDYVFDPSGNLLHRIRRDDGTQNPATSTAAYFTVFAADTALYDAFGKLHADIDTQTEGFAKALLDPVGYRGQQGQYTDVETLSVDAGTVASGTYLSLLGPAGLYYDPVTGQADGWNQIHAIEHYAKS